MSRFHALRSFLFMIPIALVANGCSSAPDSDVRRDDELWARNNTRWASNGATTTISVCWETRGDEDIKPLVRDTVIGSWGAAAAIDFVGWEPCDARPADLRVRFADEGARVADFGSRLKGMPGGITLNATFLNWSRSCLANRNTCVIGQTMHEFGHALGFLHEQDRGDAPAGACNLRTDTPTADAMVLSDYDPSSIMNYCNPEYFTRPHLSDADIEGVRRVYGARASTNVADRCAFATGFNGALCASGLGDTDSKTLLTCSGNRTVASTVCANGCRINPPGQPDECNPTSGVVDPCARANGFNGAVCASGLGADAHSAELLVCNQNRTIASTTCANGCKTNAPGVNDECVANNPCAIATGFEGASCGVGLGMGAESRELFVCSQNKTRSAAVCVNGCRTNAPGTSDICNPTNPCAVSQGFQGWLCGSLLNDPDANVIHLCRDNRTIVSTTCTNGCRVGPGLLSVCN